MKIAILGFAREGHSILKFLEKNRQFKNAEIWILDKNSKSVSGIKNKVSGIETGPGYLKNLADFDIIFRSPGIAYLLPEIQKAKELGTKISSATNLFFERCSGKIIGVTGTKGKGTTSTLLYKIFKASGKNVFLVGNIGEPALDMLPKINKKSIVVFELSSFQLQDLESSPDIAVVLDIFPDHLDAHKNLKEYYDAKANIGRHQKPGDKIFFFKNSVLSARIASKGKGLKIGVDEKPFTLFSPDDLRIKGAHNFKNAVMATAVARSLGVPEKIIAKTICNFAGMEHRLELVRKIKTKQSEIYFYNDSASHNPTSAAAAVKSFSGEKIILIAGGKDRNLDFEPLVNAMIKSGTRAVVLFGENKKKIKKAISKAKNGELGIKEVENLKEAVKYAYELVKKITIYSGPVIILLSPGSASFDMFKDYEERGNIFKDIVKKLKK